MGWKGTLRSVRASIRAAEREAKRRQRELERQQREHQKMLELEQAAYEVEVFENYLERLVSLHVECSDPIDWRTIASAPRPKEPLPITDHQAEAEQQLSDYAPGFLDKIFQRVERKQARLAEEVEEAKARDRRQTEIALEEHEEALVEWADSREFAERILAGDRQAFMEALDELAAFDELRDIGSTVGFELADGKPMEAVLHVHGEQVVPREQKSLLKSGKLSVKQMPKGKFYELYQDAVCSAVLRVASEVLAILPIEMVVVTAVDELLDTRTGHLAEQPILSVAIPRETLQKMNLQRIDPSDAMENFVHNMDLKKTKGFQPIEKVSIPQ